MLYRWSYWPAADLKVSLTKQPLATSFLFGFAMQCMFSTKSAIFVKFELIRSGPFVFSGRVISVFTLRTHKGYDYSHL